MTSPGIELATEWVTILPETAELVKRLKKFEPPPIHVKLIVDKAGNAKSVFDEKAVVKEAEKTGKKAGEAIVSQTEKAVKKDNSVEKAAAKTGEGIRREIVKPIAKVQEDIAKAVTPKDTGKVRGAAQRIGQAIREAITRESEKAGEESGSKIAKGIDRAKGAVTKAERSLADARIAAANIESRIRQQEERVQQLRKQSATGLKQVAAEEKAYNDMRANAEKHTADQIAAQERRVQTTQAAQESRAVRLNAAEESRGRLINSREGASNRAANAADNFATKEAALATALSMQNDPLEENNKKMQQGGIAAGGMMASVVAMGKQMLVTTGLFTGGLGLAGAITYTLKTGNQFTDTMNKMQGVLNANGEQMGQLNQRARELGRDFTLPATSANDAATAMFELTKAGFSAQQAMDAAKGSLQLSAAAGIDAADAAYITGTALNAFGLQATDAGKVTDILANAANLFPGEMTDFGYSISQAGAVAKSFGIDIEDTTTALGFLAKAGIKSSDAGTLIKTMLLSLTDSGKPAQAAIKDLGLQLYDQEGNFKGIEYVYNRLNQASKEMTQEQYQAATATLFGTDAARFAGLAAGESAPKWDEFRNRIDETGTAARVADARMQGLPGAIEKMKNAGQSLALTIYDMVKGPLEDIVTVIAKIVLAFDNWLAGPFIDFIKKYKDEFKGVAIVLGSYVAILAAIKVATLAWTAAQWLLDAAINASGITLVVFAIAALVAGVIYAYKHFEGFRNVVDAVGRALRDAWNASLPTLKIIGAAIKDFWNNILVPFGKWLGGVWLNYAKFMWSNVWVPAFKAIGTAAMWLWNNVLKPFIGWIVQHGPEIKAGFEVGFNAIKTVFNGIKTAVMFVWNNVLKPWFSWLSAEWKIVWFAIQVGWEVGKRVFNAVGDVVMWLWNTIFKPAFQGIGEIVMGVWNFLKQVWEGWVTAFHVVGDAAMWLWHTIFEPVWEAIKSGWDTLWNYLSPIFDVFKSGIQGLGDIASKIADGIKTAWSGLENVFKAPLHALGAFLVAIPDNILGIEVPFIGDIHKWGQNLVGLATGGVIRGPGTGTSDSILGMADGVPTVRVSNGEGVVPANVMATPLGRALFQALLGMAGGGKIPEGVIMWPPKPVGPTNEQPGGVPNINPGAGPGIGLPDWGRPGTKFGPPPPGWWLHPINPDDVLFPDNMPPGRGDWKDIWDKDKRETGMLRLPGYKTGGVIGDFMTQADDAGYLMGGFSMSAFDCSGLVSAMVNTSMGRMWNEGPPGGSARTGTATEAAWLESQGFQKGSGGSGTLRVGFRNGGAGGGHTAGTLPDGTNFESTSGGVRFGSEASGAADFSEQWFLPRNGPEAPGSNGIPASAMGASSGAFSSKGIYGGGAGGKLSSSTSGSTAGGIEYDDKKIREAGDRLADRETQLTNAQTRLDEFLQKQAAGETVKQSTIDSAQSQVDKFTRERDEAAADLETAKQGEYKEGKGSDKSSTGGTDDWSSVGGMIFDGFLESMGFDGSVFKNLLDTPNVKSAMAGLNWGLGMLFPDSTENASAGAPQDLGLDNGGGALGAGADILAGVGDQAGLNFPNQATAAPGAPGPGNRGPLVVMNQPNLGVSPGALDDKVGEMTAADNRHPSLGPN